MQHVKNTRFNSAPMENAPDGPTDLELIEAALNGQQYGYEELVHRYQSRLIGSLNGLVQCPSIAEDIAQDAFAKAFVHLKSFQRHSQFYTWLYRIAMNSRSNYFRRTHRDLPLEDHSQSAQQATHERQETPPEYSLRREACEQVREAMTRLDDAHRKILELREFEGRDYQEIAEILHVRTGTVRSRLSRARAALKQRLTR